ncbi:extracellular solute-binding protein [Nocardioides sp. zg-ZUI104]|uniref:ABC transporter substrate-binding protein n=1 Tax=Nocardioides faecalis TaxID=2803858 RepID=UPI001BCC8348|nr:extracellular solute-binding protein [Nocardioides faecalis]MBS4751719.1 extracellular solute-binding protein [Nocardioides faecalis]
MTQSGRLGWRTGATVLVVAITVLVGMLVLSARDHDKQPAAPAASTSAKPLRLEFAVWGSKAEIDAYAGVVADYNASSEGTEVALRSWPSAEAMLTDVRTGKADPDLYLLPRSDLAETVAQKRNQPLLDLLNEREIAIGDDFSRDAVSAFSMADDLQCMPYTTSPMVMYYNTELVDFDAMAQAGLPTPNEERVSWNFTQFRAAAEFASRPRERTRGVYIEPSLDGLAPFVYSGGGQVYDNQVAPTRLALGDGDAVGALRQTLELLRDPRLTLSSKQLARQPALEWFKRGKLGMIAGYRDLTPQLRAVEGLSFDVMPMPSLGRNLTVGELSGICLSPGKPGRVSAAANFLTYLVSDEAIARVTETGYIQPTKLTVAFSPAFLQPGRAPEHAIVFNNSVRNIVLDPLITDGAQLRALVASDIVALLIDPVLPDDLDAVLRSIDEKSRSLLDPDYEPADDPSASPGGSSSEPQPSD